jgi:hypothetical protein
MPHQWTGDDNLAAFYVYKYGVGNLPYSQEDIAMKRGIKPSSFGMRDPKFSSYRWQRRIG